MVRGTKTKDKAAPSSTILRRDENGQDMDEKWHYRSVIGKLNFLEKSTRPEIAYAAHQAARFCSNPKRSHAIAVKYLARYLQGTQDEGLILDPKVDRSFETYADADFSGNWIQENAMNDPSTAKLRTGYVVMLSAVP